VAESFFLPPPRRWDIVHTGQWQAIEGIGNRLQVSVGPMQVDQSVFQAGVFEYDLEGTQVGSGFQPVGGTAMPETVWR
jgi:hypothetical protein